MIGRDEALQKIQDRIAEIRRLQQYIVIYWAASEGKASAFITEHPKHSTWNAKIIILQTQSWQTSTWKFGVIYIWPEIDEKITLYHAEVRFSLMRLWTFDTLVKLTWLSYSYWRRLSIKYPKMYSQSLIPLGRHIYSESFDLVTKAGWCASLWKSILFPRHQMREHK